MAELSLAQGYAEALHALARARRETDIVEAELRVLAQLLRKDGEFRRTLRDPNTAEPEREQRVRELLKTTVGELVTGHVSTMMQHGNGHLIGEMIERYLDARARTAERITAEVHTILPLDEERLARMEAALTTRMNRPIRVQALIDESILGGVLIRIGNELIDATVRTRLEHVRTAMRRHVSGLAGKSGG